eukprot:785499_1
MNQFVYNPNGSSSNSNPFYKTYANDGPYIYSLRFIIVHSGTLESGHYKCMTADAMDKYHLFSDRDHNACRSKEYTNYFGHKRRPRCETAYVLGYVKVQREDSYLFTKKDNANDIPQGDRIGDALPNSNVDEDIAIELDPVDALPNSNDEMSLNNNNGIQTDRRGKKRRHRNDNIESQCGHRYNTRSRAKKRRTST